MATKNITVIPATLDLHTRVPKASTAKRRVAGYARVSTDSDEQYTSYEAQVDYYTKYIQRNPNWSFVGVYTPSYNSHTQSGGSYNSNQGVTKKVNTTPAMTKEEAERLRGTGYHGTRPYSTAESIELKAAQVKCRTCGMHSDNGANSQCDECTYNELHGLD